MPDRYQAPKGTLDVLPPGDGGAPFDSAEFAALVARFARLVETAGFGLIVGPMYEDIAVYARVGAHSEGERTLDDHLGRAERAHLDARARLTELRETERNADQEIARLTARIDTETRSLAGTAVITYHNRSPDTLPSLYLHLYQNLHAPGAVRNPGATPRYRTRPRNGSVRSLELFASSAVGSAHDRIAAR